MVGVDKIYKYDREMFQRAVDDRFDMLSRRSIVADDFMMDALRHISAYDGIDNEQKSLTEASSEFFRELDDMMAQVPLWCGPAVWRMFLDYDMTDIHNILAPCTFIKPKVYAHIVSVWDKLHEHALEMEMRAKEKVSNEYKKIDGE